MEIREAGETEEFVGAFEGIMEAFSIYPELLEEVVWKSLQKEEAE